MKAYHYLHFLWVLALVACVGNLDTTNKRFAAFEVSYKNALLEVQQLDASNSLKPETKRKVADLLEDVNKARTVARTARDSGDLLNAQDKLSLAIAALDKLKEILPKGGQL